MSELYVGDRDKTVELTLAVDPSVDGTTVTSVRLFVKPPRAAESEWTVSITNKTTTVVTVEHTLDSGGGDLAEFGRYLTRAWLYVGASIVDDTKEGSFDVLESNIDWPT